MRITDLNALPPDDAAAEFLRCCGSAKWARQMAVRRPFRCEGDMVEAADQIWIALEPADWLEAFAAHPRIGAGGAGGPGRAGGAGGAGSSERAQGVQGGEGALERTPREEWAEQEQSGMRSADSRVRQRLAETNREYEDRFGYIFIVCATGKSADEMLALLEQRLDNPPERELAIAAEEQSRITRIRLHKLLTGDAPEAIK